MNGTALQKCVTLTGCWKLLKTPKCHLEQLRFLWFIPNRKPGTASSDLFKKWMFFDFSPENIHAWLKNKQQETPLKHQRILGDKKMQMGISKAAALFILTHDGAIKFKDQDEWTKLMPMDMIGSFFDEMDELEIEGIDASKTKIMFEGLKHICELPDLKYLNLSNCPYIDDFCLSKLHVWRDTLEYLDVSGCENVTQNGLICLHHLKNLKYLRINNLKNVREVELITILLEETCPNLTVLGVDHEHLNSVLDSS